MYVHVPEQEYLPWVMKYTNSFVIIILYLVVWSMLIFKPPLRGCLKERKGAFENYKIYIKKIFDLYICKFDPIKMRPHRLIHNMNKLTLDLYFPICFSFSSVNSINLCAHHLLSELNIS